MSGTSPHDLRIADGGDRPVVSFTLDGRLLTGVEGEPIAAALHAQGVRVLGRSFKYRRPRGLHCVADACPNCAMRVNGLPGVTTCATPLREGDTVERQKGLPGAGHDVLGALDHASRLSPVGFQYRRFRRSPRLFAAWERVMARLAGTGRLPSAEAARAIAAAATFSSIRTDVAVIGGGAAGLAAALAAARSGAQVVLVEREPALGGWLRYGGGPEERAEAQALEREVVNAPSIDRRIGWTASAWYSEDALALTSPAGLCELRSNAVVLATGGHERPLAFADNDRPGVMLAGGVHRLLRLHGVRPGRRAVVATSEDYGYVVATELAAGGVELAAVADARAAPGDGAREAAAALRELGIALLAGTRVRAAEGRTAVRGVTIDTDGGGRRTLDCDTIVVANGRRPVHELLLQRTAGLPPAMIDPSAPVAEHWWMAGLAAGVVDPRRAVRDATAAGEAAAGGSAGR